MGYTRERDSMKNGLHADMCGERKGGCEKKRTEMEVTEKRSDSVETIFLNGSKL